MDRAHKFDRGILPQMAELGLLGISVPANYGGAGMDYVCLGLASEELEYVDTSLRVIMSVHVGLNSLTLLAWGTEDQKQRYLVPQAQGKKIATFGLTEPSAGSDARGIQTVAIKKGDRICSPARRCGSRWPTSPTTSSCLRGAIWRRRSSAIHPGSARSSSSARSRDSRAAR
jgi:alkylation response protein AidB-like acyl-CoA dehydrogenase